METTYADIKNTPTYKILQKNLEEASKRYLYCHQQPLTDKNIQKTNQSIDSILNHLDTIQSSHILKSVNDTVQQNYIKSTNATNIFHYNTTIQSTPSVYFDMHPNAKFLPKICPESNSFDLPLQETHTFQPYKLKKID